MLYPIWSKQPRCQAEPAALPVTAHTHEQHPALPRDAKALQGLSDCRIMQRLLGYKLCWPARCTPYPIISVPCKEYEVAMNLDENDRTGAVAENHWAPPPQPSRPCACARRAFRGHRRRRRLFRNRARPRAHRIAARGDPRRCPAARAIAHRGHPAQGGAACSGRN